MKHLYRCLLYVLLVALLAILGMILFNGVEASLDSLLVHTDLLDKRDAILPHTEYLSLPIVILGFLLPIVLIICGLWKESVVMKAIGFFVRSFADAFRNLFSNLKLIEIICVLAIPFAVSIYFANDIAVSYDEAITYNYFTIKPFYYCMIFYPYPNNHVLHTLLTTLTDQLPFLSALVKMRIPAILFSLLTWLIGYSFLKKYYSSRVAMVVVGLASVCYLSIYYSFMSRGYAFMVLAFVICLYAAFNIIYKGNRLKDWMFFVVAGVLGAYTIPSFLYPFSTVNVLILIYNYKNIKYQFWANVIVGILVIVAYAPIMIVDGVAALTSNQFVQHIARGEIFQNIPLFYLGMFSDIVGVPYWAASILLIPFIFTIIQKDKKHLMLWTIFLLAPFVLIIAHAVNPFYRTFLYYNFAAFFLMAVPFQKYLERIPMYIVILGVIVIQCFAVYSFDSKIRIREGFNTDASEVSNKFFQKGRSIVFPCIASSNYEFEANVRGLNDDIHFLNNEKANVDTINNYEYVILEIRRDVTEHKKPFYSTPRQNIYKNEK